MAGIRGKILVLFIVPLFLYVGLLSVMPLMEPDESRYSIIPSFMNESGDYVMPRLKEAVYIEKPPLAYWATALSFKIFGENEFSARLFVGLCAWGSILLVYSMGRFFHDEKTGLYAAAVLTTSLFHFAVGRINILDMPVAFFLSLAIWAGYRYCTPGGRKEWLYLSYLAAALAFLTKGLIGIVFPAAVIIIWLMAVKRWRDIIKLLSPLGILIFFAVALPWPILAQQAHDDFFRFFFIQEHWQRYTTTMHNRGEPVYYYLPIVILGTLPWCAFLWPALKGKVHRWNEANFFRREQLVFLSVWAGFIILFFSISSSKMIPYIAAVFLPLSLFMGRIFRRHDERREGPFDKACGEPVEPLRAGSGQWKFSWSQIPVIFQSLVFVAGLAIVPFFAKDRPVTLWWAWIAVPVALQFCLIFLPGYVRRRTGGNWFVTVYVIAALFFGSLVFPLTHFLTPYKSALVLVQAVKKYMPAGQELYQYDMSLYGLDFYGRMRTPVVGDIGEVSYGSAFLPPAERAHYFLTAPEFFKLARERREIYFTTKKQERVEQLRKELPQLTVLWDNKYYYLLKLTNS